MVRVLQCVSRPGKSEWRVWSLTWRKAPARQSGIARPTPPGAPKSALYSIPGAYTEGQPNTGSEPNTAIQPNVVVRSTAEQTCCRTIHYSDPGASSGSSQNTAKRRDNPLPSRTQGSESSRRLALQPSSTQAHRRSWVCRPGGLPPSPGSARAQSPRCPTGARSPR
jgi:hypothetical protein